MKESAKESALYLASLLERTVRAGAVLVGGVARETTEVLLPLRIRRTRLYQVTVAQLLRIIIEMIGDVKGIYPHEQLPVGELFVRKSAGNVIELSGFLAMGWSPVWLLAAASDLIGGTKAYLSALVEELKRANVLPEDANISSFEELLNALEGTSGTLAETIVVLPLNMKDMRIAWESLQQNVSRLPDPAQLASIFSELQRAAQHEQRSLLEISAIVALGAVRTGIQMGHIHLFEYYRSALQMIANEGLIAYLRRVSEPYRAQIVRHFDPKTPTFTDRFLRRLLERRLSSEANEEQEQQLTDTAQREAKVSPEETPPVQRRAPDHDTWERIV